MQPKPKRRRRMLALKIHEISAVDRPAMRGATVAIVKRNSEDQTMNYHDEVNGRLTIEVAAQEIAEREPHLSRTQVLRKARLDNPDALAVWNGDRPVAKRRDDFDGIITEDNLVACGKRAFDDCVDELVADTGISRTDACTIVRKDMPHAYYALQGVMPDDMPDDIDKAQHGRDMQELQLKAEGIKHAEGCSGTEAMRRARQRHPDLYAATQVSKADDLAGMPSRDTVVADGEAKRNWLQLVAAVQDRMARTSGQAVRFTEAMQAARKENPELFDAYQEVALPNPVLRGRSV